MAVMWKTLRPARVKTKYAAGRTGNLIHVIHPFAEHYCSFTRYTRSDLTIVELTIITLCNNPRFIHDPHLFLDMNEVDTFRAKKLEKRKVYRWCRACLYSQTVRDGLPNPVKNLGSDS